MAERPVAVRSFPGRLSLGSPASWLGRLGVSTLAFGLGGLVLIGLALRLVWVFYTNTIPLGGDPHWYYIVAANVANGFGFVSNSGSSVLGEQVGPGEPTAFWPPAYSLVLAGFWKVLGIGAPSDAAITSAKVLNAVLGAATIPLVYALGSRLFDRKVGFAAAALFAVLPNGIVWAPVLFPEPLFVFLFVAALWILVAYPPGSRRDWLALAAFGAIVGIATLTRGQGTSLIPIAALFWLGRHGWRGSIRPTALSVIVAGIVIAPWTVRNYVEMDAFVPVSTNSGAALRVGHNAESTGTTKWTDDVVNGFHMWESPYRPDWEVRGYREYTDLAVDYALTHPAHEVELSGLKVYHLYRSDAVVIPWLTTLGSTPLEPERLEDALRWLLDSSYFLVLFAAVASVPLWARRDAKRLLLLNIVVVWTLFHIVFLGEPRYHVPLYPVFVISAAAGVFAAARHGSRLLASRHTRVAAPNEATPA